MNIELNHPQNFEGLLLGCMNSYDSESRRIFQDFARSKRILCTAPITKFQQKFVQNFAKLNIEIFNIFALVQFHFAIFLLNFNEILSEFRDKFQKMMKIVEILSKNAKFL